MSAKCAQQSMILTYQIFCVLLCPCLVLGNFRLLLREKGIVRKFKKKISNPIDNYNLREIVI